MRQAIFTNQFKDTPSEAERRRLFLERMERKLAFKEALRRYQRHHLMRG